MRSLHLPLHAGYPRFHHYIDTKYGKHASPTEVYLYSPNQKLLCLSRPCIQTSPRLPQTQIAPTLSRLIAFANTVLVLYLSFTIFYGGPQARSCKMTTHCYHCLAINYNTGTLAQSPTIVAKLSRGQCGRVYYSSTMRQLSMVFWPLTMPEETSPDFATYFLITWKVH